MKLSDAYGRLFSIPGYSFIVDRNGVCVEWDADYMSVRGLSADSVSGPPLHIVPGSFNPLHQSHMEIYEAIDADHKLHTFFEMSVERVDKAMVSLSELEERLKQFVGYAPVIVSRAPRFVTKIGTYRSHVNNIVFHVGIDTITRMADDYGVLGIQGLAANFVVHDRIMNERRLSLASEFREYIPRNCVASTVSRCDESLTRSSTSIRKTRIS